MDIGKSHFIRQPQLKSSLCKQYLHQVGLGDGCQGNCINIQLSNLANDPSEEKIERGRREREDDKVKPICKDKETLFSQESVESINLVDNDVGIC